MGQEGRSVSPGGALPTPTLALPIKAGAKLDMEVMRKCAAESASCKAASLSLGLSQLRRAWLLSRALLDRCPASKDSPCQAEHLCSWHCLLALSGV